MSVFGNCNRCGKLCDGVHTCTPRGGIDQTRFDNIYFENWFDGTRPKIDTSKQDPGVILQQVKRRGINKL